MMQRPKRRIISRSLEYNNGMLHEEEIALRRALHASLNASKAVDNEEDSSDDSNLASYKKQGKISNLRAPGVDEGGQGNKRECDDESVGSNEKKKQKKLLVKIKPKHVRRKGLGNSTSKEVLKKKIMKSKTFMTKKILAAKENDGRVIKRRRRKKNADQMMNNGNTKSNESLPKVHVQRKFPQTSPASPRSLLLFQSQMQPMTTRAKTEDFLDFLCLRGSTRMPKCLEMFNNPCAPVSPLTDEDDSCKTASKTSANEEKNDNEPDAKQNLITQLGESPVSSSPSSLVSSPVSMRVQPHTILPQFTSNHDVLTHIPTPIPYPTPPTPTKQPGFDVYGAPSATRVTPSLVPNQPRVSSMVVETHMSSGQRQGFHPVSQSGPAKETISISPKKVGENGGKLLRSPKKSPEKRQEKSGSKVQANNQGQYSKESPNKKQGKFPCKQQEVIPNKLSKEGQPIGSPNAGKKSKRRSLNFESIAMDIPDGCQEDHGREEQGSYVPVFKPMEIEFKNPLKYIESIKAKAELFGICVIVPPTTWQPEYCLSDEIRFTTKLQHIHCLGKNHPTVEDELAAIKKHLEQQSIFLSPMPQIAGCEVDLPLMSKVVEEFGGLQQIIDKRKWTKVADKLQIPKTAVDSITKLEHIYCKYLLSYDMLSKEEKTKLLADEENKRNEEPGSSKTKREFMTKGRSMSLAIFQRNAKNANELYMKHTQSENIEDFFWQMTDEGRRYVVVHSAQFDGTAFPTRKKPFYKSKWNLNILPRLPGSLARDLPDVEGVTSPLVKVEMVLSTETWHSPAHDMFVLEYLHQGENKIWNSVPHHSKDRFLDVIKTELNGNIDHIKNRAISRSSLIKSGVPVYKVVQEPGQFIVKFPGAYHSSLAAGFCVSEFVSFAPLSYIPQIKQTFQGDFKSEVDHMFSWECLIVSSIKEEMRRNGCEESLNILIPELKELRDVEARLQSELSSLGVAEKSRSDSCSPEKKPRGRRINSSEIENCHECKRFCFPSVIMDNSETPLCLNHALEKLKEQKSAEYVQTFHLSLSDLNELIKEAEEKLRLIQTMPRKVKKCQAGDTTSFEGNNKIEAFGSE